VSQDVALEEGVELALHKLRQVGADGGFGLREEGRCVQPYQAVQRGLLRAEALAVDRGAIGQTLTFYLLPRQHNKLLKSTNMLERLNEEIKRRPD